MVPGARLLQMLQFDPVGKIQQCNFDLANSTVVDVRVVQASREGQLHQGRQVSPV